MAAPESQQRPGPWGPGPLPSPWPHRGGGDRSGRDNAEGPNAEKRQSRGDHPKAGDRDSGAGAAAEGPLGPGGQLSPRDGRGWHGGRARGRRATCHAQPQRQPLPGARGAWGAPAPEGQGQGLCTAANTAPPSPVARPALPVSRGLQPVSSAAACGPPAPHGPSYGEHSGRSPAPVPGTRQDAGGPPWGPASRPQWSHKALGEGAVAQFSGSRFCSRPDGQHERQQIRCHTPRRS